MWLCVSNHFCTYVYFEYDYKHNSQNFESHLVLATQLTKYSRLYIWADSCLFLPMFTIKQRPCPATLTSIVLVTDKIICNCKQTTRCCFKISNTDINFEISKIGSSKWYILCSVYFIIFQTLFKIVNNSAKIIV